MSDPKRLSNSEISYPASSFSSPLFDHRLFPITYFSPLSNSIAHKLISSIPYIMSFSLKALEFLDLVIFKYLK